MTRQQCQEAIKLHGVTHSRMATAATQRQDWEHFSRSNAIAAAAARGVLLRPTSKEANIPDLVAAAIEHGMLEENAAKPTMDKAACLEQVKQHGISHRLQQQAASTNGNHGKAKRHDEIALAAESGKLLADDDSVPHLVDAARTHGLIAPDASK